MFIISDNFFCLITDLFKIKKKFKWNGNENENAKKMLNLKEKNSKTLKNVLKKISNISLTNSYIEFLFLNL